MRTLSPDKLKSLRRKILRWYSKNGRDFFWRRSRDPYMICVSEIMLHQTQASRVNERFLQFMRRYPTLRAVARSSKADVVRSWHSLGYNNRAVRLWELADMHDGRLPRDVESLQSLPGIGKYTAHAIACFACGKAVPIVDVNVRRVFSRIFWKAKHPLDYRPVNEIWKLAETVLPKRSAYNWNQALLDLGATVCVARRPLCAQCPITNLCASMHLATWSSRNGRYPARSRPEPSYQGIRQRHWRGRVVEAFRQLTDGRMMSIERLGKEIKKPFRKSELPWLTSIIEKLEKDNIVTSRRARTTMYVGLARE